MLTQTLGLLLVACAAAGGDPLRDSLDAYEQKALGNPDPGDSHSRYYLLVQHRQETHGFIAVQRTMMSSVYSISHCVLRRGVWNPVGGEGVLDAALTTPLSQRAVETIDGKVVRPDLAREARQLQAQRSRLARLLEISSWTAPERRRILNLDNYE